MSNNFKDLRNEQDELLYELPERLRRRVARLMGKWYKHGYDDGKHDAAVAVAMVEEVITNAFSELHDGLTDND